MYREKSFDFKRTMFGLLMMVCVLCGAMTVSAQGWSSGLGKSSARSPASPAKTSAAPKPSAPAAKAARSGKTGNVATAGSSNAASSGHEKGTATSSKTSTGITANKGSRERVVGDAKRDSKTSSASARKTESDTAANPPKTGRCDPDTDERTDLSGTYSGSVNYPAGGLAGDATLTISGNRFTLNSGSKTEAGNITAITTCNYTAVALMFGQWETPQPGEPVQPPLPMLSLRATRKGDKLTLLPAPSERRIFSFEPAAKK
jgi:hypothetical protein